MAWTSPKTWSTSELVTAALLNTQLRDNLNYLFAGKKKVYVPASFMSPATTNGCASLANIELAAQKPELRVLDFDGATKEYALFELALPSYWNEGTISYRVYWTVGSAATTSVVFGLQGVAASNDDAINSAFGTAGEVVDTGLNAANDQHLSAESSAITISGSPAAGDMIYFQFYRDPANASDTMTQDARLIGIDLFYTADDVYEA